MKITENMLSFQFDIARKKWCALVEVYDHDALTQAVTTCETDISKDGEAIIHRLLEKPEGIISRIWFMKENDPSNGPHGEPAYMAFNKAGAMTAAKVVENTESVRDLDDAEMQVVTKQLKSLTV